MSAHHKAGRTRLPVAKHPWGGMRDNGWSLPSGEDLVTYALRAGLAAQPIYLAVKHEGTVGFERLLETPPPQPKALRHS